MKQVQIKSQEFWTTAEKPVVRRRGRKKGKASTQVRYHIEGNQNNQTRKEDSGSNNQMIRGHN
jgi:hypothetical protein